jgi:hypothetical protein
MTDQALSDFKASITEFAEAVVGRLGEQVESVLYYPHPFHVGGVVVVLRDDCESLLDSVSEVYSCAQLRISLHCLRRAELFKLSLPGMFVLPNPVSEHLHLAMWLKHRGVVLYGRDLRDEIPPPINQHLLLNIHIEACQHSVRPGIILTSLMTKTYPQLIDWMNMQARYLMATALLVRGVWDVSMETIPAQFESLYRDDQMREVSQKLASLYQVDPANEHACRRAAYESVWLFESFLRQLRKHVP